jgi:hypothetical protein
MSDPPINALKAGFSGNIGIPLTNSVPYDPNAARRVTGSPNVNFIDNVGLPHVPRVAREIPFDSGYNSPSQVSGRRSLSPRLRRSRAREDLKVAYFQDIENRNGQRFKLWITYPRGTTSQ